MNAKLYVHITSSLVAAAGALLAVGDKITAIPALPPYLVNAWPIVVFVATLIDRIGSAIVDNANNQSIESPKMITYIFFREGFFYPLDLENDAVARKNAEFNPGTIRVENAATRQTIWPETAGGPN